MEIIKDLHYLSTVGTSEDGALYSNTGARDRRYLINIIVCRPKPLSCCSMDNHGPEGALFRQAKPI
jgi:hypothetical protein